MPRSSRISPRAIEQIAHAIGSIRYGTVQITIHDARVVQIEKVEKTRVVLDADPSMGSHETQPLTDRPSGGSRSDGR